ncbi:MAG: hypothetical protein F6K26_52150 [Moorea sp. SIO2I5]|nr:hypothetical protein [Moorena sp. SIO2I5]
MYCTNIKQDKYAAHNGHLVVEMADKLGFPCLAAELEMWQKLTTTNEIPPELCNHSNQHSSFFIAPRRKRSFLVRLKNIFLSNRSGGLYSRERVG